ncbi:unnamed protein product, partial [Ectocarpus sp. 8 AP-2014]
ARSRGPTTASFKDVVEGYAAQNGVMFLPKPGRQHEGKQASLCVIDGGSFCLF